MAGAPSANARFPYSGPRAGEGSNGRNAWDRPDRVSGRSSRARAGQKEIRAKPLKLLNFDPKEQAVAGGQQDRSDRLATLALRGRVGTARVAGDVCSLCVPLKSCSRITREFPLLPLFSPRPSPISRRHPSPARCEQHDQHHRGAGSGCVHPKGLDISAAFYETRPSSTFNQDEMKLVYSLMSNVTAVRKMESCRDIENTGRVNQRCVLIVDDEPLNLKLFALTLTRRGYRVLQATDGFQAFVLAHDGRPDLIVMDVQLPEISGLEITRTLKNSIHTNNIPIVVATAFLIDEEKLRESGCDGYITKPYAMKDFIELIESLIERNPQVVATV